MQNLTKSLELSRTCNGGFRAIVFCCSDGVWLVEDVAESSELGSLNAWFNDVYSGEHVRVYIDGDLMEPDCLTTFEAAEAAMI